MHDSSHEQDERRRKSKVEKKQVTRQETVRSEGPAIPESEREAVVQMLEETEEYRKIVEVCQEKVTLRWNGRCSTGDGIAGAGRCGQGTNEGDGMWTQMGGGSKEKWKARRARATAAGQGIATAARRARAKWAARGRAAATGGARTKATNKGRTQNRSNASKCVSVKMIN